MRVPIGLLFVGLLSTSLFTIPVGAQDAEERAVLAVAQQIFDGINKNDGQLIRNAMMPDGILYSTTDRAGTAQAYFTSAEDFASQVEAGTDKYHERMFETTVHIQEGVALIWAAYDFHLNGSFSHCGVDTFSLVKTPEGWKVASLTYTVEREGCGDRPPIPKTSIE